MVFDGALVTPRHENHLPDARCVGLFDRILNEWLVHYRQHFLGLRLGGGQETRAETGNRENSFSDGLLVAGHRESDSLFNQEGWEGDGGQSDGTAAKRMPSRAPVGCQPNRTSWS